MEINLLQQKIKLEQTVRRAVLGFFGYATIDDRSTISLEPPETVIPKRGLFPYQKRAASAIERYLYFDDSRALLHLPDRHW